MGALSAVLAGLGVVVALWLGLLLMETAARLVVMIG